MVPTSLVSRNKSEKKKIFLLYFNQAKLLIYKWMHFGVFIGSSCPYQLIYLWTLYSKGTRVYTPEGTDCTTEQNDLNHIIESPLLLRRKEAKKS
jgi:hypothetical protein